MADLKKLLEIKGVFAAGEFDDNGNLVAFEGDITEEEAAMAAKMCWANNAMATVQIEGSEQPPVYVNVKNGKVVDYGLATNGKYDFEMWATPENWKTLATGGMGPKAAMLTKKLKFKGSMITAMKYMSPFEESLKMMSKIPTEW